MKRQNTESNYPRSLNNHSKESWKEVTVFISSTFVDMNIERDILNNYVLPKLNEYLKKEMINVHIVDLRWGVRTEAIASETERDRKVLSVCFDEIDRCQPFFVALLGDRYGYDALDQHTLDSVYNDRFREINDMDVQGKSVTELEILYGALLHPEKQLANSIFCMRNADYSGMPETVLDYYTYGASKMGALRDKVINACNTYNQIDSIIEYNVSGWDPENKRFMSFDKVGFGDVLYQKLAELIERHFVIMDENKSSFPEQLFYEQKSFLIRHDSAIGMNNRIHSLLDNSCHLNIIQGESGIGKTTLFKYLANHLISDAGNKHVLYYNAGLSARCRNVQNMLICWIWQLEKAFDVNIPDLETKSAEELRVELESIIQMGRDLGYEFWFVIDSFDSLYKNAVSESLSFLRFATKSFVATQKGSRTHFQWGLSFQVLTLRGLDLDETENMMKNLFQEHHKEWNPNLWEIIQNKCKEKINPLWIQLAVDILSSLSANDYSKIKALKSETIDGSQALDLYLITLVKEFPSTVPGLFLYLYTKVIEDEKWSIDEQFILWYISVSRNGIRESDLARLMPNWDSLVFASMRYRFHSCIEEKGVDNCWGFSHTVYNKALEWYINKIGNHGDSIDLLEKLHDSLGRHYCRCDKQYDLRKSECAYHLISGNNKELTALYLIESRLEDNEDAYNFVMREIADIIINHHEDNRRYNVIPQPAPEKGIVLTPIKVPKGMPIPEYGVINNSAVLWLMDIINTKAVSDNHYGGLLISILSLDLPCYLYERGASSANLILNLELQSLLSHIVIPNEERIHCALSINKNIANTLSELGSSFSRFYRKAGTIDNSSYSYSGTNDNDNYNDSNCERIVAEFSERFSSAQMEAFHGNYIKAISICESLLKEEDYYSRCMPDSVYSKFKIDCLLCMADSHIKVGHDEKALAIYGSFEDSYENGSKEWFFYQERFYTLFYHKQKESCLNVAKEYLTRAEINFFKNKVGFYNLTTLIHGYVLYLKAIIDINEDDSIIEKHINRTKQLFSQFRYEYNYDKQLLIDYSVFYEVLGIYYYSKGRHKDAEMALKKKLDICGFLIGIEPLNHSASQNFIEANEDLGFFYLTIGDYAQAQDYFADVLRLLSRWNDSEEKLLRAENAHKSLEHTTEKIKEKLSSAGATDVIIRFEGFGYYYLINKEFHKAQHLFTDAIQEMDKWDDSEDKQLKLCETYVALCRTMSNIDTEGTKKLIIEFTNIIDGLKLLQEPIRTYFSNILKSML